MSNKEYVKDYEGIEIMRLVSGNIVAESGIKDWYLNS